MTTSDGADVDRPYDVVSISSYLIFYRWPHTSDSVVCLAIDFGFADDVETIAGASDFHLRVLVDASGDARGDLELLLRSRDGELGRLHLFDRRSRESTSREIKPGKDATLELSIHRNDLNATHDLRVWAFLDDGSAGGRLHSRGPTPCFAHTGPLCTRREAANRRRPRSLHLHR